MSDILVYTASHIDVDDLSKCVESRAKSTKYYDLEKFMDGIMEHFDIHYIYIVAPINDGDKPVIYGCFDGPYSL